MTDNFKKLLIEISKVPWRAGDWSIKDDILYFKVNGFCKSGTVSLYEIEGCDVIYCLARYEELDRIENFDDLVGIAFQWYRRSLDRNNEYQVPHEWEEDFIRLGYIEKVIETKTKYKLKQ